ncbi:cytosine/adenosine deaminase-related metal-dependent hydrolase [Nocardiopsis sp. L17-MgMaSL7]|nr:cytosine/adenosine deaminase-related metal-dependent hydrolase [Nocardiopsis sp. L17-MgMaSL7]
MGQNRCQERYGPNFSFPYGHTHPQLKGSWYTSFMDQVIRARYVLAHSEGSHVWLRDGYVAHSDGVVTEVGTGTPTSTAPVLDLGDSILTPGLIDLDALVDIDHLILDAHHDPAHARSLVGSVEHWRDRPRDVLTPEQRDTLRRFGLAQLALHGVTTYMPIASEIHLEWNESAEELRHLADLTRDWGLRGYLGPSYRSAVGAVADGERTFVEDPARGESGLDEALRFADELSERDDDLVRPVLLPCRIETLTPELLERTAKEAAKRGLLVRLHSLQQPWERKVIIERHGLTPLDLIERSGLLNDRLLIPHALWTDRNPELTGPNGVDLTRLARAGVSVIHCPLTTFRYGDILETFNDFLAAGVTMALGTDSFPPDLVRGMDVGLHASRLLHGHGAASLSGYMSAATLGGAAALKRPDLGRLEAGASADLTAFSLDDFRDGVVEDPLRTLVLNGTARNATHTFVAGRPVVTDGRLPGVDLVALRNQAQEVFEELQRGYSERDGLHRPVEALFPPSFPVLGAESKDARTGRG